ncbi:MAG: GlsB/YeaQ/YmgE family stress response membrane protein [Pyrinomonadaceae bacterium]
MHFIAWIIAGLIAGFIASKIVNKTGEGVLLDILLGLVGGLAGGWLFSLLGINFGQAGGLNIASIIVAVIGAVILLVVYHAIRRNM